MSNLDAVFTTDGYIYVGFISDDIAEGIVMSRFYTVLNGNRLVENPGTILVDRDQITYLMEYCELPTTFTTASGRKIRDELMTARLQQT